MNAKLSDEPARLRALGRLNVLDTPPEAAFERVTALVRTVLDVPISAVSLVDRGRQWFKSIDGLQSAETPRDVAFCAHTIMARTPLIVADASLDPRFATSPLVTAPPGVRSYAGVPLASPDGYNLGALCAIDTRPRTFSAAQIALLGDFGALVVGELELRLRAQRDHVTGVMTRRAFVDGVNREIDRNDRHGQPCSLIVFDIDRFKAINDAFGHGTGDQVLQSATTACAAALRPQDLFGRIGGEEFAICLPDTTLSAAVACAERLRTAIGRNSDSRLPLPRVTASFGISTLLGIETYDEWFARADCAMYAAKRSGRNLCRVDDQTLALGAAA